jgi:hypothetical protein
MMKTIEEELLAACREIAVHTMWNEETPRSLDDIITVEEREAVAEAYYHEALHQLELVRHYPEDPWVVLRAVRYLQGHAMPPIRDNIAWFRESLSTLLLIVCPFAATSPAGEPFFADLRRGMERAEGSGKTGSQ